MNTDRTSESYRWLVTGVVMLATFMAVLDATIVNVALSKLMSTFGVAVDEVEWVLTAYMLIFGVTLPSTGWFADHWGYKRMFMAGLVLFTVGSFLCSLAWSLSALIVFRVIQGAGAGVLMPVGMAVVTREFPPERRGVAIGLWAVAASASVSLGPTLGGWLIDRYSWHTIFDINVPVGIVAVILASMVLHEHKADETRSFDVLGFLSLTAFLTALLLALASGNSAWNTGGWTSPFILTCAAISLVSLVIFLVTEFSIRHPLIAVVLFENFNFAVTNIATFLFGLGMFGSTFLLPIYLQNALGYTPLQAGMVFLPVGLLTAITAPLAGHYSDRHSPKHPAVLGLLLMALSFYQYSTLSYLTEKAQIMLPLYIRGVAMGLCMSPLTTMAIREIPNRQMAQASGLLNVIRQVGGSFGVAVFGTLVTRRTVFHDAIYGGQLAPGSPALNIALQRLSGFAMRAEGGTRALATERANMMVGRYVQNQAFIQAIADVFFLVSIVLVLSIIPVLFTRRHEISRAMAGPKVMAGAKVAAVVACAAALAWRPGIARAEDAAAARAPAESLTVTDAVHRVLASHPAVDAAKRAVEATSARVRVSRSAFAPEVTGSATYARIHPVPIISVGPASLEMAPADNVDIHLGLRETVYDFGRRELGVELAETGEASAGDNLERTQQDLAYRTIGIFQAALFFQEDVTVVDGEIAALEEHQEITRKKIAAGTATDLDLLTTEVRVADAGNRRVDAVRQLENERAALRVLLGMPADAALGLRGGFDVVPVSLNGDSLLEVARRELPEMRASLRAEAAADLQRRLATLDDKASLEVNLAAGFLNGYPPDLEKPKPDWVAGAGLRVPIFNGHRRESRVAEAEANLAAAHARTGELGRRIETGVRQAVVNLTASRDKLDTAALQVKQASKALEFAERRYEAGVLTNLDVIDAETSLANARLGELRARYDFTADRFALEEAVGGRPW